MANGKKNMFVLGTHTWVPAARSLKVPSGMKDTSLPCRERMRRDVSPIRESRSTHPSLLNETILQQLITSLY